MDPITLGLLLGAGGGLLKSELIDRPMAAKQRALAAATQRYSPWTGLHAEPVQEANPFNEMLKYGSTGAMIGSGVGGQGAVAAKTMASSQNPYSKTDQPEELQYDPAQFGAVQGKKPQFIFG